VALERRLRLLRIRRDERVTAPLRAAEHPEAPEPYRARLARIRLDVARLRRVRRAVYLDARETWSIGVVAALRAQPAVGIAAAAAAARHHDAEGAYEPEHHSQ
jgi:hypothetical protein